MDDIDDFEKINGKIYYQYIIYPEALFVYNLYVKAEYRGKHLPRILFQALMKKWHKDIILECEEPLYLYYTKMGFEMIEDKDKNNRYLMELKNVEDFKKRIREEYVELRERLTKLDVAMNKEGFEEKVGVIQFNLMRKQSVGMHVYAKALEERMENLGINTKTTNVSFGKVIEEKNSVKD